MKIGQYKQMKAYLTRPKRVFPTDTSKKLSTVKNTKTVIAPVNIKIDPIPISLAEPIDPTLAEQEKKFLKNVEDINKEKQRLKTTGLAYLMGQS
jgi:hypothetical protein